MTEFAHVYSELEPILNELQEIGIKVNTIDELNSKEINYQEAIPILIKWIPIVKNDSLKNALIRAISITWTKKYPDAKKILICEFKKENTNEDMRWVIGNALEVISDDSIFLDLEEIIQNEKYGSSKEMIILALAKMKIYKNEAIEIAISLLENDEFAAFAIEVLRKLNAKKALKQIEPFVNHTNSFYRRLAKKTIKKLQA